MSSRLVVCSGCCCGRVDRGHSEVPVDALNSAWEKHDLENSVGLTISGCLGPCKMHNVSLLLVGGGTIWLGGLSEEAHFEALVEWARDVSQNGESAKLPEILTKQIFEPESVKDDLVENLLANQINGTTKSAISA